MKIYLYDRKEAIKNSCYIRSGYYENIKSISLLVLICILIVAFSFFIPIICILLKWYSLANFGLIILLPIGFIIAAFIIPIKYSKEYNKCSAWLGKAIIKDENNKIWLVYPIHEDSVFITKRDEFYKVFNKEMNGVVTELKNIKMVKENKRYYICTYEDSNGNNKTIEIAKAYKDLKEVL
ncbi:MAG TPA: hypothetical protein IAB68_04220 [Candidatus Aphodocola excrementigallinarum]|uniref:Uncharacterized protein n=1 Tax=Candidatus Aphodocola excrementigallinarum TaxID=2840670 RepID=A0A9D1IPP5_9FIRM|nr:hypothetical protein [Candidatus Aphodocola excrementigallinarum]